MGVPGPKAAGAVGGLLCLGAMATHLSIVHNARAQQFANAAARSLDGIANASTLTAAFGLLRPNAAPPATELVPPPAPRPWVSLSFPIDSLLEEPSIREAAPVQATRPAPARPAPAPAPAVTAAS